MLSLRRSLAYSLILFAAGLAVLLWLPGPSSGDRLAYISAGKLYVGSPGSTHLVPGPGNAYEPVFSYDGQWLAFLRQHWAGYGGASQLWIARADGSGAHPVSSMGTVYLGSFQWSPTADVLAVQTQPPKGPAPILLIPAHGKPRSVSGLSGQPWDSFLWSPDGKSLAATVTSPSGYTQIKLIAGNTDRSYSPPGVGRIDPFSLAGWWPNAHSLLYWLDPGGCYSCIADGTQLVDYDLDTRKVRTIGITLPYYHDWIAIHGNRLLVVTGGDRSAFFRKHLQLCVASAPCKMLPTGGPGHISLDPAWSPNGRIAYVVAPAWKTLGFLSNRLYMHWLDAHVLWTAQTNGSGARPAPGVPSGAQSPEWTRDGRGIVFVKDGALWLDPNLGSATPRIIARLIPPNSTPSLQSPTYQTWYYGHMDWHNLYAWY